MRTVVYALAVTLGALSQGCVGDGDVVAVAERRALFDLAAFVDHQDSVLAGAAVRKRVRVGEVDEERVIQDVDWAAELAPFAGANVNRPALVDEYRSERVGGGGGGAYTLVLTPLDSTEQRVRELRIVCAEGTADGDCPYAAVREVLVRTGFESVIADTEQRLRWTPAGYEVRSRQRVVGSEERVLVLEGEVVR